MKEKGTEERKKKKGRKEVLFHYLCPQLKDFVVPPSLELGMSVWHPSVCRKLLKTLIIHPPYGHEICHVPMLCSLTEKSELIHVICFGQWDDLYQFLALNSIGLVCFCLLTLAFLLFLR